MIRPASRHRTSVRHRSFLVHVAALSFLLGLGGCATSKPDFVIPPSTTDDPLAQAKASLASGNEIQATERLTKFLEQNPGSIHVDEANYLLGQAYLEQKDRVLAADYFQKVTRDFPQSPLAGESSYYLAVSYDHLSRPASLDQDWTERAIGAYRIFQVKYPDHPRVAEAGARILALEDRLAQKAYDTGALYLKMNRAASAEIYFQRVIEQFPNSSWACRSSVGLGEGYLKRAMWEKAVPQLQAAIDACPAGSSNERAVKLLAEAREGLARLPAPTTDVSADSAAAPDTASAP